MICVGDRTTAVEFYNQAARAVNDKSNPQNLTTAYNLFVSSVYADPTWWQAHYQAANNIADLKYHAAAVAGYRRALTCEMSDLDRAKVASNMCDQLTKLGRVKEAEWYGVQATTLDPKLQTGWINLSVAYQLLREIKMSLHAAEKAYALDPDNMAAQVCLSFGLLFDQQYVRGLDLFECRYRAALYSFTQYPYPKWRGEENCTLMLVADQGMGDTLDYARFVPRMLERVRFAHIAVHRELMRPLQQAFIKHDNVDIVPLLPNFRQADYYTSFVSLPWSMSLTQEEYVNTPQIVLPNSGVASMYGQSWKTKDAKFHIGIAWAGSNLNQINQYRSIPLECFLQLYEVPGIQLYSLQVGERSEDMHKGGAAVVIKDLTPHIGDVSDTVSFLEHLDLVISCESALPHICAAVGKKCWVPYSYLGKDYRLGVAGEIKLWMPKTRVFLQEEGESWESVFERIVPALREKVDELGRKSKSKVA